MHELCRVITSESTRLRCQIQEGIILGATTKDYGVLRYWKCLHKRLKTQVNFFLMHQTHVTLASGVTFGQLTIDFTYKILLDNAFFAGHP